MTSRSLALPAGVVALVACLLAPAVAAGFDGQTRKLTASATSSFFESSFSPKGEWLVFNAWDPVEENVVLYAGRRWVNSALVRLSEPAIPHFALVREFEIARHERRVVYRSDVTGDGYQDLSSVPIRGPAGASVRLSPDAVPGGRVYEFVLAPNGWRVVFWGDLAAVGTLELWTAPVGGSSQAVRLHPPLSPGQGVGVLFRFSADGSRVLFLGEIDATSGFALWSSPADGSGPPVRLSPPRSGGFGGVRYPPDFVQSGGSVVFQGDFDPVDGWELWSSPFDGSGPPVRLDSPASSTDVSVGSFVTGGLGDRVVFEVQEQSVPRFDLFSVPIEGPSAAAVRLSPPSDGGPWSTVRLSANGSHVLFTGTFTQPFVRDLYSVPIQGPWTDFVQLNPAYPSGEQLRFYFPSPSQERVVFEHQGPGALELDLWSVPVTGPSTAAVRLSPVAPGSSVTFQDWFLSGDTRIVFLLDDEIWSSPVDGSEPAFRLHGSLPALGRVVPESIRVAEGSSNVAFCGDVRVGGVLEVFVADAANPAVPTRTVNPDPVAGGDADCDLSLSPKGRGVLFWGDFETDEVDDLWIGDEMIFGSDFDEEADTSEWSLTQQ